jgi:hypothetical protein
VNRNAARTLALAALAVLALALAAATLDSAVVTDGGGSLGAGPNERGAVGPGDQQSTGLDSEAMGGSAPIFTFCYPVLNEPWVVGLGILAFLLLGAAAYRSTGSMLPPVVLVVSIGLPALLLHRILTSCATASSEGGGLIPFGGNGTSILPRGGGASGGLDPGQTVSTPTTVFGVLLIVAILGAVLLLFVSTGDDETPTGAPEQPPEDHEAQAAIGAAAGAAADRIEAAADVDNEIYRAWVEMTRHLDVSNPDASTPAEFAAAAVEAGMDRDDVTELTDLFEVVRYGDATPTEERERRAVEALRRIESEYASDPGGES